ncbi:curli-like amyloid fiber formation chaperone CsgH [Qipengyuania sp. MTN3-11]|uniref:curli-like amyloid fiber formation chaperone CsgH n=1 Tax=Qipengyuania sp. MTN3-11 TaxID=3056557 RepID=UPI0036F2D0A0
MAATAVAEGETAMPRDRAFTMEVSETDHNAELEVIARSPIDQTVEYEIEIQGSSHARHRGKTSLQAGAESTLSKFKVSFADSWCARLTVREQDLAPYEVEAGTCSGGAPADA